jgi:hypothetical protein
MAGVIYLALRGGGAGGRTDFASPATARLFPSVAATAAASPRATLRMSTTSCDSLTGSMLAANAAEVIQSMAAVEVGRCGLKPIIICGGSA